MNFYLAASSLIRSELALLTVSPYVYVGIGVLAVLLLALALRNKKSNAAEPAIESAPISPAVPVSVTDDDDLIAVIAAAVYAFGESAGQKLAVKSIRQVTSRKEGRSAWASAGVYENTRPF